MRKRVDVGAAKPALWRLQHPCAVRQRDLGGAVGGTVDDEDFGGTPAAAIPCWHQSTNWPMVISSLSAGTTIDNSGLSTSCDGFLKVTPPPSEPFGPRLIEFPAVIVIPGYISNP